MNSKSVRKVSYVISIWHELQHEGMAVWCGHLETAAGQYLNFGTLAELNRLLCELGGWMDPLTPGMPPQIGADLEPKT